MVSPTMLPRIVHDAWSQGLKGRCPVDIWKQSLACSNWNEVLNIWADVPHRERNHYHRALPPVAAHVSNLGRCSWPWGSDTSGTFVGSAGVAITKGTRPGVQEGSRRRFYDSRILAHVESWVLMCPCSPKYPRQVESGVDSGWSSGRLCLTLRAPGRPRQRQVSLMCSCSTRT